MADEKTTYVVLRSENANGPWEELDRIDVSKRARAVQAIQDLLDQPEQEAAGWYLALPESVYKPRLVNVKTQSVVTFDAESPPSPDEQPFLPGGSVSGAIRDHDDA